MINSLTDPKTGTLRSSPVSDPLIRIKARMESVPDAIIQEILSQMNNACHIATCSCTSKRWNECTQFVPSLYFPRNAFDAVLLSQSDATITRMVSSATRLKELVIYCPFLASSMASWLSLRSPTLRILELRMDMASEDNPDGTWLDCIGFTKGLEDLKLWGVSLNKSPDWGAFDRLHNLEIVGADITGDALKNALQACPNLTDLALLRCRGVDSIDIKMEKLESCRLEFSGMGNHSLSFTSTRIRVLDVKGFSWIHVNGNHRLTHLCIAGNSGRVYKVEIGNLAELEYLCLRGIQWSWSAIDSLLRCASGVKHLVMKIEFSGDHDTLEPFPEIDLVDYFNCHPKLKSFEIHGAMFAALCQKNSLKNLDWRFNIPCLEEVLITVRSPLNAEQKLNTLDSLVKYSEKLHELVIRLKNYDDSTADFFKEIHRFQFKNNRIVFIR